MITTDVRNKLEASRILSHGQITVLPFSLTPTGTPFSIFIIPVTDSDAPVKIPVKLYRETGSAADCPFNVKCWTEPAITEIPLAAIVLDDYDVYWGSGSFAEEFEAEP